MTAPPVLRVRQAFELVPGDLIVVPNGNVRRKVHGAVTANGVTELVTGVTRYHLAFDRPVAVVVPGPRTTDSWHAERRALHRATQQAVCPTCSDPVGSLLAGCPKPGCVTADTAHDKAIDRRCDL